MILERKDLSSKTSLRQILGEELPHLFSFDFPKLKQEFLAAKLGRGQSLLKVIAIAITAVIPSRLLLCRTGTAPAYTVIICLFSY